MKDITNIPGCSIQYHIYHRSKLFALILGNPLLAIIYKAEDDYEAYLKALDLDLNAPTGIIVKTVYATVR